MPSKVVLIYYIITSSMCHDTPLRPPRWTKGKEYCFEVVHLGGRRWTPGWTGPRSLRRNKKKFFAILGQGWGKMNAFYYSSIN